jgi:hypothetical protein
MNRIFEQAIANVNSAYPSIYTKEDVVKLINDLRAGVEATDLDRPSFDLETLKDFKQSLLEGVKSLSIEDFVSLELSYDNRIDVDVDERGLINEIDQCFEIAVTEVLPSPAE